MYYLNIDRSLCIHLIGNMKRWKTTQKIGITIKTLLSKLPITYRLTTSWWLTRFLFFCYISRKICQLNVHKNLEKEQNASQFTKLDLPITEFDEGKGDKFQPSRKICVTCIFSALYKLSVDYQNQHEVTEIKGACA